MPGRHHQVLRQKDPARGPEAPQSAALRPPRSRDRRRRRRRRRRVNARRHRQQSGRGRGRRGRHSRRRADEPGRADPPGRHRGRAAVGQEGEAREWSNQSHDSSHELANRPFLGEIERLESFFMSF